MNNELHITRPVGQNEYCVTDNSCTILFAGSYMQCLIYVGAMQIEENHKLATEHAMSIKRRD